MALREGAALSGQDLRLDGLTDTAQIVDVGVPQGTLLIAFADAVFSNDAERLPGARQAVVDALGPAAMVDAAAVAGDFQFAVRIADATGIPVDAPVQVMSEDTRAALGIDEFTAAANTSELPKLKQLLLKLVARPVFRWMIKRQRAARG